MTYDDYLSLDDVNIQVSAEGVEALKCLVETYANFPWVGDTEQINALAFNDNGFDDNGLMHNELRSHETTSGAPYAYTLDFEDHYEVKYTYRQKVRLFEQCIQNTEAASAAALMADSRYNLNAASCDDQSAWNEAMNRLGWPFAHNNEGG